MPLVVKWAVTKRSDGKLTMAQEMAVAELGVLIYPGAQLAAVHGLTDLFAVAQRIADEQASAQLPRLRVSHWRAQEGEVPTRVFDSFAGPQGRMVALLIPPSIAGFSEGLVSQALMTWLRARHADGTVLGDRKSVVQGERV